MRTPRPVTLLSAAVLAAGAALAAAAPAQAENPIVRLVNVQNGRCLQPVGGSTLAGAAIVQQACDGSPAQQWTVTPVSSTRVHLVDRGTGLCLDARGKAVDGTPVQQWPCNGISNESWEPEDVPTDSFPRLFSRVSGTRSHCLDIPGDEDRVPGLAMQLYRCNSTEAQLWWLPSTEGN